MELPKECIPYLGHFMVITCPYCSDRKYIPCEEDTPAIPDEGRKRNCLKCGKTMLLMSDSERE